MSGSRVIPAEKGLHIRKEIRKSWMFNLKSRNSHWKRTDFEATADAGRRRWEGLGSVMN